MAAETCGLCSSIEQPCLLTPPLPLKLKPSAPHLVNRYSPVNGLNRSTSPEWSSCKQIVAGQLTVMHAVDVLQLPVIPLGLVSMHKTVPGDVPLATRA